MGTAVIVNTVADTALGDMQHEHMELGQYSFGWRRSRAVHTNMRLLQSLAHGKRAAVSGSSETVRVKVKVCLSLPS